MVRRQQLDGRLSQAIRSDQGLAIHFGQEAKVMIAARVRLRAYVDACAGRGLPVELHDLADWAKSLLRWPDLTGKSYVKSRNS